MQLRHFGVLFVSLTCICSHQAYQHLFYLLQTNPSYFAKLIFEMPQSKTTKFMENVILTVFNFASNQREEYLMLKLFETALKEEVASKVDELKEIITGNPTVIKMVVHFNRLVVDYSVASKLQTCWCSVNVGNMKTSCKVSPNYHSHVIACTKYSNLYYS